MVSFRSLAQPRPRAAMNPDPFRMSRSLDLHKNGLLNDYTWMMMLMVEV